MFYGQYQIKKVYCQCMFFWAKVNKKIHISVNNSEVKDSINETKDEEPYVTDNSVINELDYFKLFKCGKNILNNLYSMYELAYMSTSQEKWDT